jgi:2,4-diaminopentanoate dehydrogenase
MAERPHTIALVGLGATGLAIGQSLHRRTDCRLVGAVDLDPSRVGRDLGELLGVGPIGVTVVSDLSEVSSVTADVAVVATTSLLETLEPTATALLQAGANVVSICEELGFPRASHPALADRLDRVAIANGVSILGTGANPGFVMDTLPLVMSCLAQEVCGVQIRRTADMSSYGAIVQKFGLGLTTEEFDLAQDAGTVIGHVGFEQTIGALADGLGWTLDDIEIDPIRPAFIAPEDRPGVHTTVARGSIAAVLHAARGYRGGRSAIDLSVHFGFFRPGDPVEPGDACRIHADDREIEVSAERGFDSFLSTVAITANLATAIIDAAPGLRTMTDLPITAVVSKGARRATDIRSRRVYSNR